MIPRAWKGWLRRVLIAALIWCTGRTSRLVRVNWHILERYHREGQPYLMGLWHNDILTGTYYLGRYRYPGMVSRSRDGEDIAWVIERFGFETLRGSTAAGASAVLRQALRRLHDGRPVIVTPDGPRGPRYALKPGIVGLARKTGVPIVPVCFSALRRWETHSWDRMRLIKPFTRVVLMVGEPIALDPAGDEEAQRVQVETAMRTLVRTAEAFSGAAAHYRDPVLEEAAGAEAR